MTSKKLYSDWQVATHSLLAGAELRFNFFEGLPHVLLGMAASDEVAARLCAAKAMRMWGRAAGAQHPLTVKFLHPDLPLRKEVESFAHGDALCSLPALRDAMKTFVFMQVVERTIEAKHATAKLNLRTNTKPTSSSVSLSMRFSEIEKNITTQAEFVQVIAEKFNRVRNLMTMVSVFGMQSSPALCKRLDLYGSLRHKDVAAVFYHRDIDAMFLEHTHLSHKAGKRSQAQKRNPYNSDEVLSSLLQHAAHQHLCKLWPKPKKSSTESGTAAKDRLEKTRVHTSSIYSSENR